MPLATRKISNEEFVTWDACVASSPQGNLFHTTTWNEMLVKNYGRQYESIYILCENDGTWLGGLVVCFYNSDIKKIVDLPFEGYNGPFFSATVTYPMSYKTTTGYEIFLALLKHIATLVDQITIRNQPAIWDVRAYLYNRWSVQTTYTHILHCSPIKDVWSKINPLLKEQITTLGCTLTPHVEFEQLRAGWTQANGYQKGDSEVLKQIQGLIELGFCSAVNLTSKDNRELTVAFLLLNKESRAINIYKTINLSEANDYDMFPSLIWQICLCFQDDYDQIDLGGSGNMVISNMKDKLGGVFTPIYIATKKNSK